MNKKHINNDYVQGRVIVAFREDPTYLNSLIFFEKNSIVSGIEVEGIEILHRPHDPQYSSHYPEKSDCDYHIALIRLKDKRKETTIKAIDILKQNPHVLYAEPDCLMHLDRVSNDPHFSVLWGMKKIRVPSAWNGFYGSAQVVVGVVDSGIDYHHQDLVNNIWANQGGEGNCGWDFFYDAHDPMDKNSHGTHVAGTIGAVGNNGIGVVGVNWNVKMAALKITGNSGVVCASAAIKAIEYGIDNKIPVLNNSWGGRIYCESLKATIDQYGGLFIASAGNNGLDNDIYPHYPASYECDNIISVAATDYSDVLTSFSNYGASTIDIAAPGTEIYSSVLNNSYGFKSGTSMAAPHVAGAAALLKGYRPDLSTPEIKDIILSSVDRIPSLYGKVLTDGRLNVNAMFDMAS